MKSFFNDDSHLHGDTRSLLGGILLDPQTRDLCSLWYCLVSVNFFEVNKASGAICTMQVRMCNYGDSL